MKSHRRTLWETLRWLVTMYRVRRTYDGLVFSRRLRFMNELRRPIPGGRVAHPDALMMLRPEDYLRALEAACRQEATL